MSEMIYVVGAVVAAPIYMYLCSLAMEKASANHVATQKTTTALLGNAQELQDAVSKTN